MKETPVPFSTLFPLGFRQNNPGNIEHTDAQMWLGASPWHGEKFETFDNPAYGLRAMYIILLHYESTGRCKTLSDYITEWDGADDAHVADYIEFVSSTLELHPDTPVSNPKTIMNMMATMVRFECGFQPYHADLYRRVFNYVRKTHNPDKEPTI